jgi:hypothetical protein
VPEWYPLRLLWVICTAYNKARKNGCAYVASDAAGVPDIAIFMGIGRDAHLVQEASFAVFMDENEKTRTV